MVENEFYPHNRILLNFTSKKNLNPQNVIDDVISTILFSIIQSSDVDLATSKSDYPHQAFKNSKICPFNFLKFYI